MSDTTTLTPSATLQTGQACSLTMRRGQVLLVRRGRLWMTRPNDPRDHVLQPGTSHVALQRETVVVEGLSREPCVYELG
jgi:hypothetical protein